MKIAQFISHFPYPEQFKDPVLAQKYICSGGEIAAYKLVTHLTHLGHELTVVTSSIDKNDQVERREGFTVLRYGAISRVGYTNFAPGMIFKSHKDIRSVDIVHIHHTTPPGGAAGLVFSKIKNKPLVVTHHGFEKADNYGGLFRRILVYLSANFYVDFLLASASRIICISPSFIHQSLFLKKYAQKTVIIPNGIDLDEYNVSIPKELARQRLGINKYESIVLFMGTLIPPKGATILIKAIKDVITQFPNTKLIIVGQGTEKPELKKMANEFAISDNVVFQGYESEILRKNLFYRACDVLVIPSVLSEMFPLVLLEGSAAGCAIVTSDLVIFKWFIQNDENGLITAAGNDEELGSAILRIVKDRSLQTHLSQMAHQRAIEFSWTKIAHQTEELYNLLVNTSS